MKVSWPTMSADDAAEIIQHNDMVAFSGFTPRRFAQSAACRDRQTRQYATPDTAAFFRFDY